MKNFLFTLFLAFLSCTHQHQSSISVKQTTNKSIELTGIDYAAIQQVKADSGNIQWQSLLPVYKMPADTDLKDYQPAQPGSYKAINHTVIFTPDTPFKKNQTYFVRYFKPGESRTIFDLLKSNRKPGALTHIDLIFKY